MKGSSLRETCFRLLLTSKKNRHQEGGYILVIVMGLVLVMSGLFLTTGLTSKVDKASGKALEEDTTGFSAAEAGLNLRAQDVRAKFIGYNRPGGTSPSSWSSCRNTSGDPVIAGSDDFECRAHDNQFRAITTQPSASGQNFKYVKVSTFVKDTTGNSPSTIRIPTNEQFGGLNAQEYRYDVTSVAYSNQALSGETPRPSSILTMSFKSRLVPLFQFAAFYENDLDFSNPAEMNLNGPIHSNNNLFLNAGSPITVRGQLSSGLKMYRGEKGTGNCNTPFSVTNPNTLQAVPCSGSGRTEITSNGSGGTISAAPWNGNIRPSIGRLVPPPSSFLDTKEDPNLTDQVEEYQYWNKADLRIALRLNSLEQPESIEVLYTNKSTNYAATADLNTTCLPTSTTLVSAPVGGVNATSITVTNASGFKVGDALRIVGTNVGMIDGTTVGSGNDFNENVITNISGNTLTLSRPLGQLISNPTGVTVYKATLWSSKTFYNYREKQGSTQTSGWQQGRLIRMLNVDVRGLMTCASAVMSDASSTGPKALNESSDGGLVWHFTVLGPNSENDVTKTPADSPNSYGIRLYNGAVLASNTAGAPEIKGLTIATDQPVYVQGDYNCTAPADVPANLQIAPNIRTDDNTNANDPGCGNPDTNRYPKNWRPAAILADSINVLSNAWTLDDKRNCDFKITPVPDPINLTTCPSPIQGNVTGNTTRRVIYPANHPLVNANGGVGVGQPANTVINAAFLGGVDITGGVNGSAGFGGTGSGGLNNYPRLHEDWQNSFTAGNKATLTYRGSMVSLGTARRINGPFCGPTWNDSNCNIYIPPVRNWSYDLFFNDANNLPPLTPRFVYLRQERFARDYEMQAALPRLFSLASIFPSNFVSLLPTSGNRLFWF